MSLSKTFDRWARDANISLLWCSNTESKEKKPWFKLVFVFEIMFTFVFVFDNDDERWETICLPGNDLGGFSSIGAQPPPGSASQPKLFLQISKYPSLTYSCKYPNILNIPAQSILAYIQISEFDLFLQISQYPSPTYSCIYPSIPNIPLRPFLASIQIFQIYQSKLFLQIYEHPKYPSPTYSCKYPKYPSPTYSCKYSNILQISNRQTVTTS